MKVMSTRAPLRRLVILACMLCIAAGALSQYSIRSTEAIGGNGDDFGTAIDRSEDGFTALGGRTTSSDQWLSQNNGGTDYWIAQLNADGDTVWSRSYGGFNNDDLYAIAYGEDRIAAFGTTRSSDGDVGNNPGLIGAWLFAVDQAGDPLFSRVYAGELGEQGVDIISLADDGYTLLVQSTSPELEGALNNGNFDYWVARVNNVGVVQWANFYGGTDADIPAKMARVQGGFLVAGSSNSSNGQVLGNNGGFDYWVVRLDIDGNVVWSQNYGGSDDDRATDIVALDDGTFLILGTTESEDGDVSQSYGGEDVWAVQIDGDGNILGDMTFGGTRNDVAERIIQLENGLLAISASSNSSDTDLNGNKGSSDAWVVYADTDGSIVQQMNYGGSEIDRFATMIENDDASITFYGTSTSQFGNLPPIVPAGRNAWLFTMAVDTVPCNTHTDCFTSELSGGLLEVETNNSQLCAASCNVGASTGPATAPGCHNFFNRPTTWFKVRTDSDAEQMTLVVSSEEFNTPQIAVLQSTGCSNFLRLDCTVGNNGVAQILNVDVEPDTAYFVVIGDESGLAGDFNFCVQITDRDFCNNTPRLYATSTSLGSPLEGPYLPGEDVQICYEIPEWEKLECNGLQGIQPSFGPGWDSTEFLVTGQPMRIDTMLTPIANGTWDWWSLGRVTYNFTNPSQGYVGGQGLPPGWYFTNLDDPPPNDEPDQTTGDITTCLDDSSRWKVCFTLKTIADCTEDLDCSVTVKSFADGEIGSNINQACQFDEPITISPILRCCINPSISPIASTTVCSGDTVLRLFDSNLQPPILYTWEVETTGNVVGAESGVGPLLEQQLFNFGAEPASATYSVSAISEGCEAPPREFTVVVRTIPSAQMALVDDAVCEDKPATLLFTFNGTPPFRAAYSVDGTMSDTLFFEGATGTAPITLSESSLINFSYFKDAQCVGSTQGSFVVNVQDNAETDTIAVICAEDTLVIGDQRLFVSGNYTVTLESAAQNGCDSIVNVQLFVRPSSGTRINTIICEGDSLVVGQTAYKETGTFQEILTDINGCDSIVDITLFVSEEILTEETALLCPGETFPWRGEDLAESGRYIDTVPANEQCDSIFTLDLTILTNMFLSETVIIPDTGNSTGGVSIRIGGGLPPYSYLWSTGDTTTNIEMVESGEYQLTVTDFAGCTSEFNFFVTTSTRDPISGLRDISVFPNPVRSGGQVFIRFENERAGLRELEAIVYDIAGKAMKRDVLSLHRGNNIHSIPFDRVQAQIALVVLRDPQSGGVNVYPVVVE